MNMTTLEILYISLCVLAISSGQLLFKKVSSLMNESNSLFAFNLIGYFILAITIYGVATLFWIYMLKSIPLSKAYGFMSLSFVFVAIGSFIFYNETINFRYIVGLCSIIAGIFFIARDRKSVV